MCEYSRKWLKERKLNLLKLHSSAWKNIPVISSFKWCTHLQIQILEKSNLPPTYCLIKDSLEWNPDICTEYWFHWPPYRSFRYSFSLYSVIPPDKRQNLLKHLDRLTQLLAFSFTIRWICLYSFSHHSGHTVYHEGYVVICCNFQVFLLFYWPEITKTEEKTSALTCHLL